MTVGMVCFFFPTMDANLGTDNAVQYFSQQLLVPTFTPQKKCHVCFRLYDMTIYYRILPDVTKYSYYHLLSYVILIHFPFVSKFNSKRTTVVLVIFRTNHPGLGATFSHLPTCDLNFRSMPNFGTHAYLFLQQSSDREEALPNYVPWCVSQRMEFRV